MSVIDRFSLKNYCSIVTGGAMGLGKAMATALAEAGSDLVIADINTDVAEKTAAELRALGVRVLVVKTDVTDPETVDNMVSQVMAEFGQIDVLINNAGITVHEKAENLKLADWNRVLNVNLNGVFIVSQAVGRIMIEQQRGSIINISSMSGIIVNTPQAQSAYNVSKAGVIMLTRSLAAEWASHNVRVNTIAPGYMKTELTRPYFEGNGEMVKQWMELTPMHRPGTPDELEGLAVYLASEASSFMTGSVLTIDGGYSVW